MPLNAINFTLLLDKIIELIIRCCTLVWCHRQTGFMYFRICPVVTYNRDGVHCSYDVISIGFNKRIKWNELWLSYLFFIRVTHSWLSETRLNRHSRGLRVVKRETARNKNHRIIVHQFSRKFLIDLGGLH